MENRLPKWSFLVILCLSSYTVSAQLQSNFFFELAQGAGNFNAPLAVEFVNASQVDQYTDYSWKIEEEEFSTEIEPNWIFREAGKYRVCLEVKNKTTSHQQCQLIEVFAPSDTEVALFE